MRRSVVLVALLLPVATAYGIRPAHFGGIFLATWQPKMAGF